MNQKSLIEPEKADLSIPPQLIADLRTMIEETRRSVATTVNAGLTLLYWQVGNRMSTEVIKGERAEYGKQIVATVSRQLAIEYGKGFLEKSLHRMIQFAGLFPDQQIILGLARHLSWSHFRLLLPIKDTLKREFYAELCRVESPLCQRSCRI